MKLTRDLTIAQIKSQLPEVTKDVIAQVINAYDSVVAEALMSGSKVQTRLGVFERYQTKPTFRRNPKTGEGIDVPAKHRVKWVPNHLLRDRIESIAV